MSFLLLKIFSKKNKYIIVSIREYLDALDLFYVIRNGQVYPKNESKLKTVYGLV